MQFPITSGPGPLNARAGGAPKLLKIAFVRELHLGVKAKYLTTQSVFATQSLDRNLDLSTSVSLAYISF